MTSFIAWLGVDSRGATSVYLASDSRITWQGNKKIDKWENGRKLFASAKYPELFGYYGTISFPSHILSQLVNLIDSDLLITPRDTPQEKFDLIYSYIRRSFHQFPSHLHEGFSIIYCSRQKARMDSVFHVNKISWTQKKGWSCEWCQMPSKSGLILSSGSGKSSIDHWQERWNNTTEKGTSRSIFSAFCDSLQSGEDPLTGGSPQLVGLYRVGTGRTFGIIHESKRYLIGLRMDKSESLANVEWRNQLFERCDWSTKKRLSKAQTHHRPSETRKQDG